MSNKIAIVISTIARDDLLLKCLNSILDVWQDGWKIFVVDQNQYHSEEKELLYKMLCRKDHPPDKQCLEVIYTDWNIGLSRARNLGVKKAWEQGFAYTIISADSIYFDQSMKELPNLLYKYSTYNLLGFEIKGRGCNWEGKLTLNPGQSFVLDFIEKDYNCEIQDVTCCRNFFVANTISLINCPWDEDLLMHEHEPWMWSYSQARNKMAWTPKITGTYIGEKTGIYAKLRQQNMQECRQKLLTKWGIKRWIEYKNHQWCSCT